MTTNYNNADGDYRGVLERHLPTAYKTIANGNDTHKGLLGALKQMLVTTESDVIQQTQRVFLSKATGWALDLYGSWVGEDRNNQSDDAYRQRIIDKITLGRDTVTNIISGIKRELNDPELTVNIYEPWRNIFILNKSLLNGPDRIMGEFYRYAIIQVTLDEFIPQSQLTKILDKYKAAGVQVFYSFNNGMSFGDELISIPLQNVYMDYKKAIINPLYFKDTFGINDLPTGELNKNIFTTNVSDINGEDVLAGSPENTYAYQYGSVPSKNIFGVVDQSVDPSSYTDPYDYVYQNTKVDLSTVGGRNLLLGTGTWEGDSTRWTKRGTVTDNSGTYRGMTIASTSAAWNSPIYSVQNAGILQVGNTYTFSTYVRNTSDTDTKVAPYYDDGIVSPIGTTTLLPAHTDWFRVSITFKCVTDPATSTLGLRWEGTDSLTNGQIQFAGYKLEEGNEATDWTPAPEDTPKTYIYPYKNSSFVNLGSKDNIFETLLKQDKKSLTIALNVEEYLNANHYKGILSSFNQSNIVGVILDVYGSPYGVSETEISVTSPNSATPIPGSWYTYDKQVLGGKLGSKIPQSSNSTSSYLFKFDSPTSVNSIVINDFYSGIGALRSLSLFDGKSSIRVKTTKEQTFGTTLVEPILSLNDTILKSYITEINLDMLPAYSMQAYNQETGKWLNISSDTDLTPYLINGAITGGSYILLRIASPGTSPSIDYIGLSLRGFINYNQVADVTNLTLDTGKLDISRLN